MNKNKWSTDRDSSHNFKNAWFAPFPNHIQSFRAPHIIFPHFFPFWTLPCFVYLSYLAEFFFFTCTQAIQAFNQLNFYNVPRLSRGLDPQLILNLFLKYISDDGGSLIQWDNSCFWLANKKVVPKNLKSRQIQYLQKFRIKYLIPNPCWCAGVGCKVDHNKYGLWRLNTIVRVP